jgi:hypothetical protein
MAEDINKKLEIMRQRQLAAAKEAEEALVDEGEYLEEADDDQAEAPLHVNSEK